eukprot:147867-Prymnesium_polylepis.1
MRYSGLLRSVPAVYLQLATHGCKLWSIRCECAQTAVQGSAKVPADTLAAAGDDLRAGDRT